MNVLICDDERRDLQMVRLHVEQFGKDQQIDVSIYTLWNPKIFGGDNGNGGKT